MGPSSLTYRQYFHNLAPTFSSSCISLLLSSCILKPKLQSSSPYPGFIIQSHTFMHFHMLFLLYDMPSHFLPTSRLNKQTAGWMNEWQINERMNEYSLRSTRKTCHLKALQLPLKTLKSSLYYLNSLSFLLVSRQCCYYQPRGVYIV